MAVSRRLRFEILRRDNFTCRYCGASAPDVALTVDHVIPEALGGPDEPSNLVSACQPCNSGKTSIAPGSPLVEAVRFDALRWSNAIKDAAWMWALNREVIDEVIAEFDQKWSGWSCTVQGKTKPIPRDLGWRLSIEQFIQAGCDSASLCYFVDVTMCKEKVRLSEKWKYYCGCVWTHVRNLQEEAFHSIATGEDIAIHLGEPGYPPFIVAESA